MKLSRQFVASMIGVVHEPKPRPLPVFHEKPKPKPVPRPPASEVVRYVDARISADEWLYGEGVILSPASYAALIAETNDSLFYERRWSK